jgi:hypothetical protein
LTQSFERRCIGMTEGKANAASQRSVAQPMGADCFSGFARVARWRVGYQKINNSGVERGGATCDDKIACPRGATAACDDFKQSHSRFGPIAWRDRAKLRCACAIAANADTKRDAAMCSLGAQPHIGGKSVEVQCSAAVDRDRDFRREPRGQRGFRQCAAQLGGELPGMQNLLGVESGERVAEHRNAVFRRDIERSDCVGKARR